MSETYRNNRGQKAPSRGSASAQRRNTDRIQTAQGTRNSSRGSAGTGTRRTASASGARRRARRRRKGPDFAKILLIIIGIVILLLCAAVGLKSCSSFDSGKETTAQKETEKAKETETEMKAEITVNGVSVHGLTLTEAREKVLKSIDWSMKVSYQGETRELPNLMAQKADAVLEEAFSKGVAGSYSLNANGLEDAVSAEAAAIASAWDVEPKNGSISSYDASSGQFTFSDEVNGTLIDREKLKNDILLAMAAGDYQATIPAVSKTVAAEITKEKARENFQKIGTYTTTTTANKDRNENIRLASAAINGIIIQPGEEFSFNLTTGNRTTAKGYRPAGAYQNGVLVEEPGGGVCQVSSTLYNAVVFSGLKTTERHAHSYEPSYVTPGEDAMVSYDGYSGPDMKFVNNSKTAVGIKTGFSNQKLTISIYGNPILESGVTLSMRSEKVKELDPPMPNYEEDPTLEPGVEVVAKAPTYGSRWVTYLVKKTGGTVTEESFLHNSTYNGKPATIKRNTSGSVLTTEGQSETGENTSTQGSHENVPSPSSPSETREPEMQGTGGPGSDAPGIGENSGPGRQTEAPLENMGPAGLVTPTESPVQTQAVPRYPGDVVMPSETASQQGPGELGMISPIG